MFSLRGTVTAAMLVVAAFSLLVQTPTASAAICTAPSCTSGGANGCDVNLGDCDNGSCNVNTGDCNGGSCVVNVKDCACYDPHGNPCNPNPGDNCVIPTDGSIRDSLECGCVVNAGTCNGDCTAETPPQCGDGGNCVVNAPASDCSGECTNVTGTYPPQACGDGGSCVVNAGDCGAGCNWAPRSGVPPTVQPGSGCGDGGDCIINTASCDGDCKADATAPKVRCADGGDCIVNTGVCRGPYEEVPDVPPPV